MKKPALGPLLGLGGSALAEGTESDASSTRG
jgi:hypothetical protein